jgi:tripartite ATP-independent transporter DctM subunit
VFIRFGIMTPSESGAFAAVYAIFVGSVIYKELTWKVFIQTLKDSTKDIAVVTLIIAMSGIFGYGIVYDRVPQVIATALMGVTNNPTLMLLVIVLILVIAGMFIETTIVALLLTPILLPVTSSLGIDPVHFGLVMMTVTTMGIMTPPVGIALYTTSAILECSVEETARASAPFFIAILSVIAVMVLFPQFTLFVPNLIFGVAK